MQILDTDIVTEKWFLRRSGEVSGPYPSVRIRHDLLDGQVTMEDEVSHDQIHWQCVAEVTEVVPHAMRADPDEEAATLGAQRWREQRKAFLTILLAVGLFGLALAITVLLDETVPVQMAACDAPPGPGVQWQHCLLMGLDAPGVNLHGANLASANLRAAQLSGADLQQADLRFINLSGANLALAQLQGADLTGADLRAANLSGVNLSGADLSFTDLTGAYIEGASFDGAKLGETIWIDGRHCAGSSVGVCADAGVR